MKYAITVISMITGLLMVSACEAPASSGSPDRALVTDGSATPSGSASVIADATPAVETRTVIETEQIPFKTRKVKDATLPTGTTEVRQRGVKGLKKRTYKVTVTDGVQTEKKLLREEVTKPPVTRVVVVGTKPESRCDPNYSGACVPISSDVDCAGGSGNGPGYVQGPVRVIGDDIYDLDRDGDGIACD